MSKKELKELLKDNLSIKIYETLDKRLKTIINVEVCFDGEVICKDATLIDDY